MSSERVDDTAAWAALAELYHRYLTGLLLGMVTRLGTAPAADVVFRTFRNQHLEAFHPGLEKLGLTGEPDAVACAKYHVLSNALGGVRVEWIPESETKSWVRYLPPRWIFDGTAVCGIPTELSRAMLRGWHGHNGVSLGNDRLGFVATSQTTDAQVGLVGYYVEEDTPLDPDDRVRFRPGEQPGRPGATVADTAMGPCAPRQSRAQLRNELHPHHSAGNDRGAWPCGHSLGRDCCWSSNRASVPPGDHADPR